MFFKHEAYDKVERKKEVLKSENRLHCTHNNWICHKSFNIYICIWMVTVSPELTWTEDMIETALSPWKREVVSVSDSRGYSLPYAGGRQEAVGEVDSRTCAIYILGPHLIGELDFMFSSLRATEVKQEW